MTGTTLFSFYDPSPPSGADVAKEVSVIEEKSTTESNAKDEPPVIAPNDSDLLVYKEEGKINQTGSDVSDVTYATLASTLASNLTSTDDGTIASTSVAPVSSPVPPASSEPAEVDDNTVTSASASRKFNEIKANVAITTCEVSEVSYSAPTPVASHHSASFATFGDGRKTTASTSESSHKLMAMMNERIQSMDKIRSMITSESQQDSEVIAKLTNEVGVQKRQMKSKCESIKSLEKHVEELKTKNAEYATQLSNMSSTVDELVESNTKNTEQIASLENDVANKEDELEETNKNLSDKQSALDNMTIENMTLEEQLEITKAKNSDLNATVEDLQARNAESATELDTLLLSIKEVVEENTLLENKVEELIETNKKQAELNESIERNNAEMLDVVEGLTSSLNEARARHEKDVGELQQENADLKQTFEEEQESSDNVILQMEKLLEETTSQMTNEMTTQKETGEKQMADLTLTLEKTNAAHAKVVSRSNQLLATIQDSKKAANTYAESTAETIGQLEKELKEDFQIATKFKRGMEDLKQKLLMEGDVECANDLEELLGSLRTSQCWQLSRFQIINKLGAETLMGVCPIFDL